VTVLLADTKFTRWIPERVDDGHGWATEGDPIDAGTITGCLTRNPPLTDNSATGEGAGQNEPKFEERATAHLNGPVDPGDRLQDPAGDMWIVEGSFYHPDHTGSGLDCWVADCWLLRED
jgi:hypothetical protein